MIVLFCGGRDWDDHARIRTDVAGLPDDALVLHGGAPGADLIAAHFAQQRGLHAVSVDALWRYHGKAAGPIRNRAMLRLRPDFAFVYDTGGRGTADMKRCLVAANITHVIHTPTVHGGTE